MHKKIFNYYFTRHLLTTLKTRGSYKTIRLASSSTRSLIPHQPSRCGWTTATSGGSAVALWWPTTVPRLQVWSPVHRSLITKSDVLVGLAT
ncbi:hypothetical protein L1987_85746 [Smallanthus sonchifolius]|uniref:Uncharacterized protein n=1 Tax=Smallanthus sonchifolius TaxID=185202 RepID=A0ACB8XYF6_9ASTR|nr:hypothetical protein L1987_85746 [Smallanthus sonchifolius]